MRVLSQQAISWERDIEGSVIIYDCPEGMYENPVATGSYSGDVIKCIAVAKDSTGVGMAQKLITELVNELHQMGRDHLFLFTMPENRRIFSELGFYHIATVQSLVTLMENDPRGLQDYLRTLVNFRIGQEETLSVAKTHSQLPVSAIVVNCNPFTLGHRAIIEQAAKESSALYIFVVTEDSSEFRTEDRLRLVRLGVQDLANVRVIPAGSYVISRQTFPSYFLKSEKIVQESHARLDCTIFRDSIAPVLGITRRYIGEEPFCPVTRNYNAVLAELLPVAGIECRIIPRFAHADRAISASDVRRLFVMGDMPGVRALVPGCTFEFLSSGAADYALQRIFRDIHGSQACTWGSD
jgi:[citrate (pro-3S)-lyase] ligase